MAKQSKPAGEPAVLPTQPPAVLGKPIFQHLARLEGISTASAFEKVGRMKVDDIARLQVAADAHRRLTEAVHQHPASSAEVKNALAACHEADAGYRGYDPRIPATNL